MKWKLGIDTGGTYTDAVLCECETGKIVSKAKTTTTKENLIVGIESAIEQLHIEEAENVDLVCLSTTLATNAVIEGKGAMVGLITIDEPKKKTYPAAYSFNIKGKVDVKGCEISPLDLESAAQCLTLMKGKVETLAISGYASVRNPIHEQKVKALADEILGVPVICAHELTNVLGYYERTVTATLNAKLIPVIKDLIEAAKEALKLKGIDAPLVIIKGDGNCMVDSFAEERPIETVLSGPAASTFGGIVLSGKGSMIVADMGGTTLDIVSIFEREIPIENSGAVVGNWRTRAKAIHTRSFGLGGDSHIRMDNLGILSFGPERAIPLCVAAEQNPDLVKEISTLALCSDYHIVERQEVDCLELFKIANIENASLESEEEAIVELLQEKSHSLLYLSKQLNKDIDSLKIKRLLALDIVQLISLTPTDILHTTGEYIQYNRAISRIAVEHLARRAKMSESEFLEYAENSFTERICTALVESLLIENDVKEGYLLDTVIQCVFDQKKQKKKFADLKLKLKVPVIGIGAPAKIWFDKVGKKLDCDVIIPENSEVAAAVGTVSGDIRESLEALIRYDYHLKRYIAYLPNQRVLFETLDEAISFTEKELMLYGKYFAERLRIKYYWSSISKDKTEAKGHHNDFQDNVVELKIKLTIFADTKNIDY